MRQYSKKCYLSRFERDEFMLCEKCGKTQATTHIRSVVNGKVYEKHLCSNCAAVEGNGYSNSSNLSQILASMFKEASPKRSVQSVRCSCCGATFSDIAKSGRCGCPECYSVFYEQLLPHLQKIHGSVKHIGKSPERTCTSVDETLENLRNKLSRLIKNEEYEQAAIVRDQIRDLEGKMQ